MPWPLVALGVSLAVGAYAQNQQNNAQRSATNRQRRALESAKKMTPEERKYLDRMQERSSTGDPNLGKMRNMVMSNIAQSQQKSQSGAQAMAIRSGLENSIVADELRRRVDRDALKQIAEESNKLAMHNTRYKEQYAGKVDQFQLQRSQYIRDLSLQQAQIPSSSEINQSGWGGFLQEKASSIGQVVSGGLGNMGMLGEGVVDTGFQFDTENGKFYKIVDGEKVYV